MARGKAPGNDGFTTELYVIMGTRISRVLWEAVPQCKKKGIMYLSGRRGTVSLIPKKHKNPIHLDQWHPLMLLNTDHKIVTKMLTNRLKPFLKKVIGEQQTGYVPGRFIGVNLRKLIDILFYLDMQQIPAVLMNIDYFKCFDSVDHESLFQALCYFNVGEYFISWIKMLYNPFEFCVTNNGRWSSYCKQQCGVHQGSTLSGPIFLYVAEILAINIKKNEQIRGVDILGNEETLGQYTDDTNIW